MKTLVVIPVDAAVFFTGERLARWPHAACSRSRPRNPATVMDSACVHKTTADWRKRTGRLPLAEAASALGTPAAASAETDVTDGVGTQLARRPLPLASGVRHVAPRPQPAADSADVLHHAGAGLWGAPLGRRNSSRLSCTWLCVTLRLIPSGMGVCGPFAVLPDAAGGTRICDHRDRPIDNPAARCPFVLCFQRPLPGQVSKPTVQKKRRRPFSFRCKGGRKKEGTLARS
ncbi:uncharacterized protein LOC142573206 [Dermacentor variabilis]|uniref:uncharacterized protein LOC142573206 n=1 Tax=Dermacentor variabilis TaxID=34621 RepID=UPI003F5BFD81